MGSAKLIYIDGYDNIIGDIHHSDGSIIAHCVQSINWNGAYQFSYLTKWQDEWITILLIKEPNQNGTLQIKVDGVYIQHNLKYDDLRRGAEEFRRLLYLIIKRYFKQS